MSIVVFLNSTVIYYFSAISEGMDMNNLKKLLKECGVSQADLARLLGRDRSVITNLMHGRRQLKAGEAEIIANHLGVAINKIYGGADNVFAASEPTMIPFQSEPTADITCNSQVIKRGKTYYLEANLPEANDRFYAYQVRDNSLNLRGVLKGDVIIAEMDAEYQDNSLVIIQHYIDSGAETLLRYYQKPLLLPYSTSPEHESFSDEQDNVRIVSPVRRLMRMF